VRDGRTVPWEDAVALFHDATGRPGPATWEVGDHPKGHEKYPVAGGFLLTPRHLPESDPFNFVKRAIIPVLMLNGRYDTTFPLESSQRPFFHILGTAGNDKKHVKYDGGHGVFPRPDAVRECLDWLDRYLGPVRRSL
jgi:hypothetical protein